MDPSAVLGNIFDVQRFSIHDGPGIRTTVFLKGCPLRCPWCSNPESQCALPQLLYLRSRCIRCGRCVSACPEDGLNLLSDAVVINRAKCLPCEECSRVCPSGAMRLVGRSATATDVLAEVERDRVFYQHSGGGLTVSGGEPLSQPEFTVALLNGARTLGLHSAVETAGLAGPETVERVLSRADLILFDIKQMDSDAHRSVVGEDNAAILGNARLAARLGVDMIIRVPVIPGFNDQPHQIAAIGEFTRSLGLSQLHVLPYHRYGTAKYANLGQRHGMPETVPPSQTQIETLCRGLEGLGLSVRAGG
ncbi:MAG: glycyl-radical enzyme activating protein [Terriglobia bacterium]